MKVVKIHWMLLFVAGLMPTLGHPAKTSDKDTTTLENKKLALQKNKEELETKMSELLQKFKNKKNPSGNTDPSNDSDNIPNNDGSDNELVHGSDRRPYKGPERDPDSRVDGNDKHRPPPLRSGGKPNCVGQGRREGPGGSPRSHGPARTSGRTVSRVKSSRGNCRSPSGNTNRRVQVRGLGHR